MRKVPLLVAIVASAAIVAAQSGDSREKRLTPSEIPWPAGASTGTSLVGSSGVSGIQTVTLKGDPTKPGLYTILLRVGPNTKIQAHSHPTIVQRPWSPAIGTSATARTSTRKR